MSSPKRETRGNASTEPAVTRSKRRNKLYCSADCSLEPAASQPRLLFRESLTATPAFKCEPSPFRSLRPPLSPPQYDLSFVKLPQLVSQVGTELPVRETVWREGPRFVTPVRAIQHSNIRKFNVEYEKPAVPREKNKTKKNRKPKYKPLTGTEVVEMLAKEKHLGEHEFYYLKASEDGPYRPYDLRVVSRSEAGTDYYTNTLTTIMHVQNDCRIELWSLEEWTRESALWGAVRNIPFFRDFLLRKTFKRWHRNAHKATVKHRIDFLPSQLLIAVPQFRGALLHLARFLSKKPTVSCFI